MIFGHFVFFFVVVVVDVCCPFLYSDGFHVTDM